jgi:hypothetical protein
MVNNILDVISEFAKSDLAVSKLQGVLCKPPLCYRHFSLRACNGPAIQVQTLNGRGKIHYLGCKWPNLGLTAGAATAVKTLKSFCMGRTYENYKINGNSAARCSKWNPRLRHSEHIILSVQVHWSPPLNVHLDFRVCRLVLEQPIQFDFSKVLNLAYGVTLNLNFGQ